MLCSYYKYVFTIVKIKCVNSGKICNKINFITKLHIFYNNQQIFYQNTYKYYNFWYLRRDGSLRDLRISATTITIHKQQPHIVNAVMNSSSIELSTYDSTTDNNRGLASKKPGSMNAVARVGGYGERPRSLQFRGK